MELFSRAILALSLFQIAFAVKVKVVMHSEQDDSKMDDEEIIRPDANWTNRKKPSQPSMLPFIKGRRKQAEEKPIQYEEDKPTTEKAQHPVHPNEIIFPLIYRQNHINSMFKFGENWYTWSTEKRTDGSKATSYYICHEEPKHCDDIGWERTDTLPKCALQIDSLMPDDRACVNSFGIEPRGGSCDGAEQMKVSDLVRSCGPRLRSLWRFVRVGRRPADAAKPADVNSLVCEDEEECFISIEYRIHHDRITFSLHEPTRGQTFKSALKREVEEETKTITPTESSHLYRRGKTNMREDEPSQRSKKFHSRPKVKTVEGKGVLKERNDSGYAANRRLVKNKIKIREDNMSEDVSE